MIEVLKQALEKIANVNAMDYEYQRWAREALAIAELESQEPVCPECKAEVLYECVACSRNNYPPQRKPLTDEQILNVARDHYNPHQRPEISFARAIEAAHGIKE